MSKPLVLTDIVIIRFTTVTLMIIALVVILYDMVQYNIIYHDIIDDITIYYNDSLSHWS